MKICTLNNIAACGIARLDPKKYTLGKDIDGAAGVLVRSAAMHDMELPPELLAIARAGAGVNNIPIDKCSQRGIVVFNTPGANANAVKELVVAALLLSSRKIVQGIEWAKTLKGQGDAVAALVEKGKSNFVGPELMGKTLGVIGLGAIGILVANVAKSLGMEVYGYDPYLSVDAAWKLSRSIQHATSLEQIYELSDYITVHVPLNDQTRGRLNAEAFGAMRDGVRILNFSRGELVNNADILQALASGKVSCYVTDFPTDELLGAENVIAIPHLGASTPESEDNCAVMAADQLHAYLQDGIIVNSVNYPEMDAPRTTDNRVCVLHKNIPHMLSRISGVLSTEGINIETMVNKSKKEYAYTVLDVVDAPPAAVLEAINDIDGVIRVRLV